MTLARPPRAPRRAPSELTFKLDEADVTGHAASEPDWLTADRRTAFDRYTALPVETNQLYTTYVDLRTADLSGVTPWPEPASAPAGIAADSAETPVDVAVGSGDDSLLTRLDQPVVFAKQFLRAAPFGVFVVPLDAECLQTALGIGECLGDDRHTLLNRNDRLDTRFRKGRAIVD